MKKKLFLLVFPALLVFLALSCASKGLEEKKARLKSMTDAELISRYQGLNQKIKDLGNADKINRESSHSPDGYRLSPQGALMPGGQIYNLKKEKELVKKEMENRNLLP